MKSKFVRCLSICDIDYLYRVTIAWISFRFYLVLALSHTCHTHLSKIFMVLCICVYCVGILVHTHPHGHREMVTSPCFQIYCVGTFPKPMCNCQIDWLYQIFTAHQHQKDHTVPKQVSPPDDDDDITRLQSFRISTFNMFERAAAESQPHWH